MLKKRKTTNSLIIRILENNRNNFLLARDILAYLRNNNIDLKPLALRHHIKQCRLEGNPIIANHNGYMIATDRHSLDEYIRLRKIEIKSELKALKHMRKWL